MGTDQHQVVETLADGQFYGELTERNRGVIEPSAQDMLRTAVVLIAGCGSIGGAAVEPLARLGIQNFLLADPGDYELSNLNRQSATADDIGCNKAEVAAGRIRAINPHARVEVFAEGVTAGTIDALTARCELIVDGVDVTTEAGLQAKLLLHEHACARRLPLFTGWDMVGAQYLRIYDYRLIRSAFDGQLTREQLERLSMWQVLRRLVPARYVPLEMIVLARSNLRNPDFQFPQLIYAATLFGALASHIAPLLLTGQPVREHIYIDFNQQARQPLARWRARIGRPLHAAGALAQLRKLKAPELRRP